MAVAVGSMHDAFGRIHIPGPAQLQPFALRRSSSDATQHLCVVRRRCQEVPGLRICKNGDVSDDSLFGHSLHLEALFGRESGKQRSHAGFQTRLAHTHSHQEPFITRCNQILIFTCFEVHTEWPNIMHSNMILSPLSSSMYSHYFSLEGGILVINNTCTWLNSTPSSLHPKVISQLDDSTRFYEMLFYIFTEEVKNNVYINVTIFLNKLKKVTSSFGTIHMILKINWILHSCKCHSTEYTVWVSIQEGLGN